ncbi:RNA-directed DNA polymerase [Proteus penneri]|nr:RNA-directed DNA polymerase [Proteus penneri]
MSSKKNYNKIYPTVDYLTDHMILLNAWKKSQQHIRNTNWYVDFIDLDKSTIELDSRIETIINAINNKNMQLTPLKLIPAPKSYPWIFRENNLFFTFFPSKESIPLVFSSKKANKISTSFIWEPKDYTSTSPKLPMRPLAHISINDQTLFTALMMLLAEEVESIQGDTSTPFENVHIKEIINYGNRLHCNYRDSKARYSWGNSNTYSKYFQDYKLFLARPLYFGKKARESKTDNEEIYEVHLDFSKFYDSVNRKLLVDKISNLIQKCTGEKPDSYIQYVLEKFKEWEWSESSYELYLQTCTNNQINTLSKEKGIPQGLVSGGFLANIYLLDFDKSLANMIGQDIGENITIIDACRYVDDLRIIIKSNKVKDIEKKIHDVISKKLTEKIEKLELLLQPEKTKIKKFRSKEGAISRKLADIQHKLSGPTPLHELDEQLGHLEGLIELSDNLDIDDENNLTIKHDFTSELAFIDKTFNDVRKDTLLRFTANKIHYLLRQKRSMIAQEVNEQGVPIPGSWDYLQERMARKLISKWSKDPSLLILLKKGLELFPHIQLLRPIILNLNNLRNKGSLNLKIFAEYCLSEILRHSATIIHTKNKWAFPAHSDTNSYFEFLENYTCNELLENINNLSEAYKEQLLFFCLVRNDSLNKISLNIEPFDLISQILNGFRVVNLNTTAEEFATSILLSYQMSMDKNKVLRSIQSSLELIYQNKNNSEKESNQKSLSRNDIIKICECIISNNLSLFREIYNKGKYLRNMWITCVREHAEYLGLNSYSRIYDDINNHNDKKLSLASVLRSPNNPFKHENAILKLLQVILNGKNIENHIDINNTTISCSNWSELLNLNKSVKLDINISYINKNNFLFHKEPLWLPIENVPLYYIGVFIRSCLLGSIDWSSTAIDSIETSSYKGIKTSILKRQISMTHSPEFFGKYKSPMSNWLSILLFKLLQWPGVENNDASYFWPEKWNIDEVRKCILLRIEEQNKLFCELSKIPAYIEKVKLEWDLNKKNLNVMMIQPILPLNSDFDKHGWKLDNFKYRAKHRRHTASISELILHNIASMDSINEVPKLKGKIDLIIWPELSISLEDLDIIERLSDKTGAIIFAGIGFSHIENNTELNNAGIWIIPNKQSTGRGFIKRLQGKQNMTTEEKNHITPWRPYQLIIELIHPAFKDKEGFKLTSSICYDATDIKLSADLKDKSHAYIISAMNKDISTFDNMVDALFYHMYQYIVLVNSGEFGGSVAKAPYKQNFNKLITHTHGSHQLSISYFEMNMFDFRQINTSLKSDKELKTPPAGTL